MNDVTIQKEVLKLKMSRRIARFSSGDLAFVHLNEGTHLGVILDFYAIDDFHSSGGVYVSTPRFNVYVFEGPYKGRLRPVDYILEAI